MREFWSPRSGGKLGGPRHISIDKATLEEKVSRLEADAEAARSEERDSENAGEEYSGGPS